jgi:hypothetical protein
MHEVKSGQGTYPLLTLTLNQIHPAYRNPKFLSDQITDGKKTKTSEVTCTHILRKQKHPDLDKLTTFRISITIVGKKIFVFGNKTYKISMIICDQIQKFVSYFKLKIP